MAAALIAFLIEPARQPVRFGHQRGIIDGLPDHAHALGLLGRHRLAQHGKAARAGIAHGARQEVRSAEIGDQRDAHEGLVEARRPRRQDDVAGQRKVGAAARRHAVDGADDGLGQRAHGADHGVEDAVHVGAQIGRHVGRRIDRAAAREIRAGAKGFSFGRQNDGTNAAIRAQLGKGLMQFGNHRIIKGIVEIVTTQPDRRHRHPGQRLAFHLYKL